MRLRTSYHPEYAALPAYDAYNMQPVLLLLLLLQACSSTPAAS
jgi:hypothetical protein